MKKILGKKIGMTQFFGEDGSATAVTVIECQPNIVLQRKSTEKEGYSAIQLGMIDKKKNSKASKAALGHAKKAGLTIPKKYLKEVRIAEELKVEPGQVLAVDIFEVGEEVSITGISIGKGFQGTVKKHNFRIGPISHGSKHHRRPGTMGALDRGGMIPKGKKKPGRMGGIQVTIHGLKIIDIIKDKNVILVSGAIPGPKNGLVVISSHQTEYAAEKFSGNKDTKPEKKVAEETAA